MRQKKSYAERRDKELKSSCIASGLFVAALGAAFGFVGASQILYENSPVSGAIILIICLVLIAVGLMCIFKGYKSLKKREINEKNIGTDEYEKFMKRRDKALRKLRKTMEKRNKSLKNELFVKRIYLGLIIWFCTVCFAVVIAGTIGILDLSAALLILPAIGVLIMLFALCGSDYPKLKSCTEKNGVDFRAAEDDFRDCILFTFLGRLFGVGDRYTFILCHSIKNSHILENKTIISAVVSYEIVDNYTNGFYSGTTRNCYVTVCTENGCTYKTQCAEFAEELIAEAYQKRIYYMHKDFSVVYPQESSDCLM